MIAKFNCFINCCTLANVLSTEWYQKVYYFSRLNSLVACRFIMSRMYIRKTSCGKIRQKTDIIPGVSLISGKASVTSVNRAGWSWGRSELHSGNFRGLCTLRTFLGSKEHLYWLKIDLTAAEIFTVQEYKYTKINVNGTTHIQESSSQASNTKRPKTILLENPAEGLGSRRERCWGYVCIYENTPEKLLHLSPKSNSSFT